MPIAATEFTPWASLAGGALIGLSAVMAMVLFGRIAGITGIATQGLGLGVSSDGRERGWRIAFLVGLVAAPVALGAAGLLVGFGTALGSGCTSGHGVCGLARLSPRSLAAVATFMATAALTVFVLRHVVGGGA